MNILKTKMVDRFYNLSPTICIYDLDGTVIDSSHRATHDEKGNIDLSDWIAKSTKDLIFQYKIYSGNWIRYQIVINLSEKLYLNKNKPSNPVVINSYFSNNLFDKADNNGKLKFRNYNMSSDFLVECQPYSITFTTYIID